MFSHGRFPVYGPLSVSPLSGLVQGTLTGAIFGAISLLPTSRLPLHDRFMGWLLSGAIIGLVSGVFAPAFRRRLTATMVVFVGVTIALLVAAPYWRLADSLSLPGGAVLGAAMAAIIYALVGWEYIEPDPNQPPQRNLWPDIFRVLLNKMRSKSRPAT